MGGRGSSSKRYDLLHKDKPYGTEYTCLYKEGRYEILQYNGGKQSKAPMETRTKGVIYGVLDKDGNLAYIVFFDENNMRSRQIDVKHYHTINGVPERPHVHIGYEHNEGGDTIPSTEEQRIIKEVSELVEKVKRKNHVR